MDSWERFNETSLPDKAFYSNLNMKDITDVDYKHAKMVFRNLINKNLGDYHDLYVQSDTLLLADVLENFRNMCIKVYELEVDVKYPKNLHDLHSDLSFLPKTMKINKCNKLVCNLYDKKNYVIHIRSFKQALNHGIIIKKVHRVIQFNQEAWLKPYIDLNSELRKQVKNNFEKDLYKLMNTVFGKTMENVRKHRDIKLVTTDKRRNQLVSEPNYHTTKWFSENLLAIEMKKTKVKMNKPV